MGESKTLTADDFEPMDFEAMPPDIRDWRKADLCLFKLYCITEETPRSDEAYAAIVELSEILTRRGVIRFVFDKAHIAKPAPGSRSYELFREIGLRSRNTR